MTVNTRKHYRILKVSVLLFFSNKNIHPFSPRNNPVFCIFAETIINRAGWQVMQVINLVRLIVVRAGRDSDGTVRDGAFLFSVNTNQLLPTDYQPVLQAAAGEEELLRLLLSPEFGPGLTIVLRVSVLRQVVPWGIWRTLLQPSQGEGRFKRPS